MTDPSKIYNDAPDEFAEFLDSEQPTVSLAKLGGLENPFIKLGIYTKCPEFEMAFVNCEFCNRLHTIDSQELSTEDNPHPLYCDNCGSEFLAYKDQHILYKIDHDALAEFISKGIDCRICRQYKKTGYMFGKLRGYDIYFACNPTEGMYKALECEPKSILIVGQNTPTLLPTALATRIIYLARLLFVKDGTLNFAHEILEEKIPLYKESKKAITNDQPKKKQPRPPVQCYTPFYLSMIAEWLVELKKQDKAEQPSKRWMSNWLYKHGPTFNRRRLSERTIYRHINQLISTKPPSKGKPDCRSPVFTAHWHGCLDISHVNHFATTDITGEIIKAFSIARETGFDVGVMKGMDAFDFATHRIGVVS